MVTRFYPRFAQMRFNGGLMTLLAPALADSSPD
jgi:hypothetical protein